MDIDDALGMFDGVARVRALLDLGIGDARIRRAVAEGRLRRPRRGWVAAPHADALLVAAAEVGVVLTCVTQARRLGIWTASADTHHVGAAPHAKLVRPPRTGTHVHWAQPAVPRGPGVLSDPVGNVPAILAVCQPYETGLAAWESAMRLGMLDREVMRRLDLAPDARRLLAEARPFADAGTETVVMSRLRWLRLPMQRQVVIAGRRVDLLVGDRLVIQIDGGHHVDSQRMADNEHDARLRLMGYHVIRVGYRQIFDDWATVQGLIARGGARAAPRCALRRRTRRRRNPEPDSLRRKRDLRRRRAGAGADRVPVGRGG
ncbi:type IV toxin-antitoxin system AbiEi family antitoxin domain-containing protein [Microbacterium marinilacus]|nr:type IV toxin-antitoxin system AbiEi family antitoxin domain-containing protein [Microbacterium marinilacus]